MVTLASASLQPNGGCLTDQCFQSLSISSCSDAILTKQPSYYGFDSYVGLPTGRKFADHANFSVFGFLL